MNDKLNINVIVPHNGSCIASNSFETKSHIRVVETFRKGSFVRESGVFLCKTKPIECFTIECSPNDFRILTCKKCRDLAVGLLKKGISIKFKKRR